MIINYVILGVPSGTLFSDKTIQGVEWGFHVILSNMYLIKWYFNGDLASIYLSFHHETEDISRKFGLLQF